MTGSQVNRFDINVMCCFKNNLGLPGSLAIENGVSG